MSSELAKVRVHRRRELADSEGLCTDVVEGTLSYRPNMTSAFRRLSQCARARALAKRVVTFAQGNRQDHDPGPFKFTEFVANLDTRQLHLTVPRSDARWPPWLRAEDR